MSTSDQYYYKCKIQYNGAKYFGWQIQKELPTIQGAINSALEKVFQSSDIYTLGAGRTDAKVHSLGQVFLARVPRKIPENGLKKALNSILPKDIIILDIIKCDEFFDPRKSVKKEYLYLFKSSEHLDVFQKDYVAQCCENLSFEVMQECLNVFKGEHDFASFYCTGSEIYTTVKTIYSIQLFKHDHSSPYMDILPVAPRSDLFVLSIQGSGFLKQMVRLMVGALWECGRGNLTRKQLENLLIKANGPEAPRKFSVAPASGLYQYAISYND